MALRAAQVPPLHASVAKDVLATENTEGHRALETKTPEVRLLCSTEALLHPRPESICGRHKYRPYTLLLTRFNTVQFAGLPCFARDVLIADTKKPVAAFSPEISPPALLLYLRFTGELLGRSSVHPGLGQGQNQQRQDAV